MIIKVCNYKLLYGYTCFLTNIYVVFDINILFGLKTLITLHDMGVRR